jgi:hypothetical protein
MALIPWIWFGLDFVAIRGLSKDCRHPHFFALTSCAAHGSAKSWGGALPRLVWIGLDAPLLVENDGQNMAPAEQRVERLTRAPASPRRERRDRQVHS